MPTITVNRGETSEIDLGKTNGMTITAIGGDASVYIDYQLSGAYLSAIKGRAGYGNPFTVKVGQSKSVSKSDLESEHVRVGAKKANISVTY
jgi:hypothetical protein